MFSSDKLSVVLHTGCVRRVRALIVVALCDVGLWDDSSSNLSVIIIIIIIVIIIIIIMIETLFKEG